MLRDGRFIKEEPPKIGRFYVPQVKEEDHTPEERFMQNVLLGHKEQQYSFLSRVFGFMLRI